ncbi:MAG: 2-C-methyl-D-erythritol 2,4-cyclodiphosphate synthase [Dehalococcoidia bacterium]|nr:2-C-methyl-D-erythritol 2,4-cyclodiphosphate synthase [Dehalococcoidia bacterium]
MKIGSGYDSHRLVAGRKLVLGGVEIAFDRGLEGWSDADAVSHAVVDALCGAACLGDIGTLFPSGDQEFRDISSIHLLERVVALVADRGFAIGNVDVTVIAEKPMLSPFVPSMRLSIAEAMGVGVDYVSVKAKTNDGMGFIGRGDGIAALAVVLLEP